MRRGVVFGGGGLVGMGYHAGVLKALDERGLDLAQADVIVGTSAGSVIASYLACGWSLTDFYDYGSGRHPDLAKHPEDREGALRSFFEPLWKSPPDRARRAVGSLFALASSRGLLGGNRARVPIPALRKMFPSGLYSTERTRARLHEDLPATWSREKLFICAADLYTGQRVAFGHPTAPDVALADAVLASTAIPGLFPPVRIGTKQYVDGGIVSATSLDLAVDAGCESILCVAPLGFRREDAQKVRNPRMWGPMFVRGLFARQLRKEVHDARRRDVSVFVIRPWIGELVSQGTNSMRDFDRSAVMEAAREGTLRILDEYEDHPAIEAARAQPSKKTG